MNAWLKRCVFNLDLNKESVSEPRTLSGRLFHSLGESSTSFSGLCYPRYYQEQDMNTFNLQLQLVFDDEFLVQGLHLKSHQRCSAAFCRPDKFFHTD